MSKCASRIITLGLYLILVVVFIEWVKGLPQ